MKPHPSLPRAKPRPCGCIGGYAIALHLCEEAERLWAEFRALGDRANSLAPEWRAYTTHFETPRKR